MRINIKLTTLFIFCLTISQNTHALSIQNNTTKDSALLIINRIIITGNVKTKENVILQELLFKEGYTIHKETLSKIIKETEESLLNTSLFNFVNIKTIYDTPNKISFFILLEERWYLWPYIILGHADRNLSSFLHNEEWSRINYGILLTKINFRGRRETIKLKARFGYKEQIQIAYDKPYLTKSKKHGISTSIAWFRQNEISYLTANDKPIFYKNKDSYIKKYTDVKFSYTYRPKHYQLHKLLISYTSSQIDDTIAILNPNYLGKRKTESQFLSIGYDFSYDKRNYKYYPTKGNNINFNINLSGLDILKNEMNSIYSIRLTAHKYFDFKTRWYSGLGAQIKTTSNTLQPYFIQQGLGYNEYLRSFEYNVIDGQHFITTRSFIKYAIIPQKIIRLKAWRWNKFNKIHYSLFSNIFFDTGYVINKYNASNNQLPNQYLISTGIGFDLTSYYDQVIRFEYSINQLGRHGLFLHLTKAF